MGILEQPSFRPSAYTTDARTESEVVRKRREKATALRRGAKRAIEKYAEIPGCKGEADAITAYLNTLERIVRLM